DRLWPADFKAADPGCARPALSTRANGGASVPCRARKPLACATSRCYLQFMIAKSGEPMLTAEEPVSAFDAAAYIHQITEEMAGLARRTGLGRIAAALDLARGLAEDTMVRANRSSQSDLGSPAPDEAA